MNYVCYVVLVAEIPQSWPQLVEEYLSNELFQLLSSNYPFPRRRSNRSKVVGCQFCVDKTSSLHGTSVTHHTLIHYYRSCKENSRVRRYQIQSNNRG